MGGSQHDAQLAEAEATLLSQPLHLPSLLPMRLFLTELDLAMRRAQVQGYSQALPTLPPVAHRTRAAAATGLRGFLALAKRKTFSRFLVIGVYFAVLLVAWKQRVSVRGAPFSCDKVSVAPLARARGAARCGCVPLVLPTVAALL